ncbi:Heat shock like protein SSE1 [Astathelohania contejeani]|uniref:Heat shock like protein SSE1 n=1 Tax=Astathelohania contejeani TaxID=164912 RepID=A0ABQ7I101_9MICR|nr:Heat shock like protein SSE1 [Thelohania contejeani]
MENVGIDIGDSKTVISSTKTEIYFDELGKRSVPTKLELTRPKRRFGNAISGDRKADLAVRHEGFRDMLGGDTLLESAQYMVMFLAYLQRLFAINTRGNPLITFTVPHYFTERERRRLVNAAHVAGLNTSYIFSDITACAMALRLKRETLEERFVVIDLGHSKTTIGHFESKDNTIAPTLVSVIKLGGRDFDNKLLALIYKNTPSMPENEITKAKLKRRLNYIKTILNSTEQVVVNIEVGDDTYRVVVKRDEYVSAINKELTKLKEFVANFKAELEDEPLRVELVGGNANNSLVKEVLGDVWGTTYATLNADEACASGAALGGGCMLFGNKKGYKFYDFTGTEISVCLSDSEVKPTVIFKRGCLYPSGVMKLSYKRSDEFALDLFEDGNKVGQLEIFLEKEEKPKEVFISLALNRLGVIEIKSIVDGNGNTVNYRFNTQELGVDIIEKISEVENKYRSIEEESEKIGDLRNSLETMLCKLPNSLAEYYPGLFEPEEYTRISAITDDLVYSHIAETLNEEKEREAKIYKELNFIREKIEKILGDISHKLQEGVINTAQEFINANKGIYTPSLYRLQGVLYQTKEKLNTLKCDFYNLVNPSEFSGLKAEVDGIIEIAKVEILKKKEEEENKKKEELKKKEEEELKRKEELRKKEEEELKRKEESKKDNKEEESKKEENNNSNKTPNDNKKEK